jgi:phosphomannomutase
VRIRDIQAGTDTDLSTGTVTDVGLPPSNVIGLYLEDGSRILVRPSGTEPKIKLYFEAILSMSVGQTVPEVRAQADVQIDAIERSMLQCMGIEG